MHKTNGTPATKPEARTWSARCECYRDHNSSSGRCNTRDASVALSNGAVVCPNCASECCASRVKA